MNHELPKSEETGRASARPFPWRCPRCQKREVAPALTAYAVEVKHDGRLHRIEIPDLAIPTCRACGEKVFSLSVDDRISAALRAKLRLLTPEQMRSSLNALGLRQRELATRLGIAEETLSRWLSGSVIQSRAMDNLLRAYFAFPEVRSALLGPAQDPSLGTAVRQQGGAGR